MAIIVKDDLFTSRAWEALERVLQTELASAQAKLETCSPDELGGFQGRVKALKELIMLPNYYKEEIYNG